MYIPRRVQSPGVGVLARGPFGLRKRVLPAEPIPVVDGENECEDVGLLADRGYIGNRRRAVRAALALEEFDNRRMRRVGREHVLRRSRKRREANDKSKPDFIAILRAPSGSPPSLREQLAPLQPFRDQIKGPRHRHDTAAGMRGAWRSASDTTYTEVQLKYCGKYCARARRLLV